MTAGQAAARIGLLLSEICRKFKSLTKKSGAGASRGTRANPLGGTPPALLKDLGIDDGGMDKASLHGRWKQELTRLRDRDRRLL